ncbi:MAG: tubulin--tyrosine ligase family protein, partial [Pseudomonadota bacterium]|nr:tubulin--tyrosine ligase family protein [Pseudomonadota bacterium]
PYDVNDVDNPFSQLTNPDINALNGGAEVPVEFVDLDRYREWLREQGHDDEHLFEQIRDLVTLTVISAVESMRRQSADCGADPQGCYELLGLDCLIDDQLKPWILECNLSPSLGVCAAPDGGADIEERVKAEVVSDTVWLVGIDSPPQPRAADGDPAEHIRLQASEEQSRAGGFERLWPLENPENYLPYFALPRLADMVLADASSAVPVERPRLVPRAAEELIAQDRVGLYDQCSGRLDWLNQSASFIWLMAMQGADPDAIADQLHQATIASGSTAFPDRWTVRKDVWDCVADWAESGRVMQRAAVADGAGDRHPVAPAIASAPEPFTIRLRCGAYCLDVHTGSRPVSARLESGLGHLRSDNVDRDTPQLQIVCDTPGYTLVLNGNVIASRITLAAVVAAIAERLVRMAANDDELSLDVGFLTGLQSKASPTGLAFVRPVEGDAFALHVAARLQQDFSRGIGLDARRPDRATSLGLPGRRGTELVTPASPDSLSRAHAVDAVVLTRIATAPDAGVITVLSAQEALADLLPLCSTGGRPIDAPTLLALVEWLENRRLYALDISDHEAAFQALRQFVYEPPVARAPARCDSIRNTQESTA